jgi:hypothetical protein
MQRYYLLKIKVHGNRLSWLTVDAASHFITPLIIPGEVQGVLNDIPAFFRILLHRGRLPVSLIIRRNACGTLPFSLIFRFT